MHTFQAPQKLPLRRMDEPSLSIWATPGITKCQPFLIPSQPGLGCLDIIIPQADTTWRAAGTTSNGVGVWRSLYDTDRYYSKRWFDLIFLLLK